jgi:EmrB/QacA subfamily drug resistance transporter
MSHPVDLLSLRRPFESAKRPLMKTVAVVMLGNFMSTLDSSIVSSAMNEISHEFSSSPALIQWISAGYMLALTVAGLVAGWIADRFGAKRIYMGSIAFFVAASVLSAFAWSAESIVVLRIIQGLSGGIIVPTGIGILARAAGPQRIGWAMGVLGASMLLDTIVGPIVGGMIVDRFSWRSIFLVNLPVGLLTLVTARGRLEMAKPSADDGPDWKGFLLLSSGLAILVYSLSFKTHAAFSGYATAAGLLVAVALFVQFVRHSLNQRHPLIDVRPFVGRTVGAAATTTFLLGIVFFGLSLVLPLYLQIVRCQSPLDAGLLLAAQSVGTMITTPIAGRLTDVISPGKVILAGLVLIGVGTLCLSMASISTPLWQIELVLFVTGVGVGSTPTMSAALRTLGNDEIGRTAGVLNVLLRVGGLFGTALAMILLAPHLSHFVSANVLDIQTSGLQSAPTLSLGELQGAFGHTFLWSFGVVLAAIASALFLPNHGVAVASAVPVNANRAANGMLHGADRRRNSNC